MSTDEDGEGSRRRSFTENMHGKWDTKNNQSRQQSSDDVITKERCSSMTKKL